MNTYYYATIKEGYDKFYKISFFKELKRVSNIHPKWLVIYFYVTILASFILILITVVSTFIKLSWFDYYAISMFINSIAFWILSYIYSGNLKSSNYSKKDRLKKIKKLNTYLVRQNFSDDTLIMLINQISEYITNNVNNTRRMTDNLYKCLFLPFSGLIGFFLSGYLTNNEIDLSEKNIFSIFFVITLFFLVSWFMSRAFYSIYQDILYSKEKRIKIALETILIYRNNTRL